ncbi:MAG: hypothetical protein KIS92_03515 [Planctomycetota bacterium]|nr:hypothetical protein [Planctomycetota bacterium]
MARIVQATRIVFVGLLAAGALAAAAEQPKELNSELARIAKGLQPGAWAEWNTKGWDESLIKMGAAGTVLGYTDRATWDARHHKLHFIGQGHLTPPPRYVTLDEATGQWKVEPTPEWAKPLSWFHAYQNNAMDEARGIFFHHPSHTNMVYRLDIEKNEWTKLPLINGAPLGHGTSMVYFPEMRSLIRFLGGTVYQYSEDTNNWKSLGDKFKCGPYHNMAVYNPVHKAVYFGGGNGSGALYKLTPDGKTAEIKECPMQLAVSAAVLTCDPTSGELIAINAEKAIAYNAKKDEWYPLDRTNWPYSYCTGMATPISNYGVILFACDGPMGKKILIYKHKPAPAAPGK